MIVLKIILFILLAVLGIILLLLILPVGADISFIGEKLSYKVKYAGINLLDSEGGGAISALMKEKSPEKEKKQKSGKSKSASEDNASDEAEAQVGNTAQETGEQSDAQVENTAQETEGQAKSEAPTEEKKPKKTLGEKVGFVIDIWNSAKRPLRKILKGFHFSKFYIDFLVADEDAYKCALNYGRVCTAVYNVLSVFSRLFTLKFRTVDITAGFACKKSRWDISFSLRFRPITAVISGIWFLITYIFRVYLPDLREKRKQKKAMMKQKTQPQGGM
ncbi:MAG: hypothetical protein IKM49_01865 [Ruminococcus sp.]|nr:hypothetical protein [Ruminococcus sp.]